jgi:hypothetical protein
MPMLDILHKGILAPQMISYNHVVLWRGLVKVGLRSYLSLADSPYQFLGAME